MTLNWHTEEDDWAEILSQCAQPWYQASFYYSSEKTLADYFPL